VYNARLAKIEARKVELMAMRDGMWCGTDAGPTSNGAGPQIEDLEQQLQALSEDSFR
jgi:hypothetical protein